MGFKYITIIWKDIVIMIMLILITEFMSGIEPHPVAMAKPTFVIKHHTIEIIREREYTPEPQIENQTQFENITERPIVFQATTNMIEEQCLTATHMWRMQEEFLANIKVVRIYNDVPKRLVIILLTIPVLMLMRYFLYLLSSISWIRNNRVFFFMMPFSTCPFCEHRPECVKCCSHVKQPKEPSTQSARKRTVKIFVTKNPEIMVSKCQPATQNSVFIKPIPTDETQIV